jgi:hypothetical protein
MTRPSFNDLIGAAYEWGASPSSNKGKTDCFQLACEVHRRLGFSDYSTKFDWVYETYNEQTFPKGLLVRWMLQNGKRLKEPVVGAVALLPANVGSALGTWVDNGLLFISAKGKVILAPTVNSASHFFWMDQ